VSARNYVETEDAFAVLRECSACHVEDSTVVLVRTPSPYGYSCRWGHEYDCASEAARALALWRSQVGRAA